MLAELLDSIGEFLSVILAMLGFGTTADTGPPPLEEGRIRVFIKHQAGHPGVLLLDLDPKWSIEDVKHQIGPKLGLQAHEMKIIFAGKELPDHIVIEDCNVGQQSFLHAVQVHIKTPVSKETLPPLITPTQNNSSLPFFQNEIHQTDEATEDLQPDEELELESSEVPAIATPKSNFYVYCNQCQGLREGKLRVRCALCLSGAFIVLRDPISWEDVLQPNHVPGSCETPNCDSSFSQFYFKCNSHVTSGEDDSSPPLPQVKRNPDLIPCLACGDSKDPMFVFDCQHATCIECFEQYALLKLSEREFVEDSEVGYSVGCPALCQNSLVKDSNHFKLLGKAQYDRYQRFGTEEYVLQAGGILCPQPDCGMGIIPIDTNCNKIACVHGCGFVFCRRCLEGWHMGECGAGAGSAPVGTSAAGSFYPAITAEMAVRAQWEDATRRAIKIHTKPCPKCRVPTQRDGGCMHMECTKCSFNWCWVCQVPWSRDCMGNHWFE